MAILPCFSKNTLKNYVQKALLISCRKCYNRQYTILRGDSILWFWGSMEEHTILKLIDQINDRFENKNTFIKMSKVKDCSVTKINCH